MVTFKDIKIFEPCLVVLVGLIDEEIIGLRKQGRLIKEIAYKYKLSERHIRRIIRNRT